MKNTSQKCSTRRLLLLGAWIGIPLVLALYAMVQPPRCGFAETTETPPICKIDGVTANGHYLNRASSTERNYDAFVTVEGDILTAKFLYSIGSRHEQNTLSINLHNGHLKAVSKMGRETRTYQTQTRINKIETAEDSTFIVILDKMDGNQVAKEAAYIIRVYESSI